MRWNKLNDSIEVDTLVKKYAVIISSASDQNRGDQALLWQACKIINDVVSVDEVYVLNSINEELEQSAKYGFKTAEPILHHPSHGMIEKTEIEYTKKKIIKWGIRATKDYVQSILLRTKLDSLIIRTLSKQQRFSYNLLKGAEIVIIKGGGFLHTYGSITDPYYIYFQLYHLRLAQFLGKRTIILPNSFGPFKGLGVKSQVYRALARTNVVMTRETISSNVLRDIGINRFEQFPDMAFGLEKENSSRVKDIIEKNKLHNYRNNVAITVRPYRFPGTKSGMELYNNYINVMAAFGDWLVSHQYNPWFIEHTYSSNPHENDDDCIIAVRKKMVSSSHYIKERSLNCREMKALYSSFDYIVGTRFHSVIFSLAERVPAVAISYSGNKSVGIMNDIGLGEYVIEACNISTEAIEKTFENLEKNKETYLGKIDRYLAFVNTENERMKSVLSYSMND